MSSFTSYSGQTTAAIIAMYDTTNPKTSHYFSSQF